MNTHSRIRLLGASVTVCILIIAVLSYNTWNLSKEVDALEVAPPLAEIGSASKLVPSWPDDFDPWSGNWDPTGQFEAARKSMDAMMNGMLPGNSIFSNQGFGLSPASPSISMFDTDDEYRIVVDVQGGPDIELNTQLEDDVLTISGVVNSATEDKASSAYGISHSSAWFSQSMTLPDPVDESSMTVDQSGEKIVVILPKLDNV